MQGKIKKNLIIISIVLFVVTLIIFCLLFNAINKKNINEKKILNEWKTEDARRNEIKTVIKSAQLIREDNSVIETHFARSSDLVPFLDTIDRLAPMVGGENEIISVDIISDTNELILGLRVLGSFESVYRFVTLLENSPYEIEFISTDIQKSSAKNDKGVNLGIKSEKTGKTFLWEGLFKIKLKSFIP